MATRRLIGHSHRRDRDGSALLYHPTQNGPDVPGHLPSTGYLFASEIRAWSTTVSKRVSPGIAPRIFPIIAKRAATAIAPISIGGVSAGGVVAAVV